MSHLSAADPQLADLVAAEEKRLDRTLNLIAAEHHSPPSVLEIMGSVFNTKTIEGYPGNRFHAGCRHVDQVETLAVERGKALFGADHVNVQPHSGTTANLAVYFSRLKPGDRVLAMSLPHGGHLSHGHRSSLTSSCFAFSHYGVDPGTGHIDYRALEEAAHALRPKMIVAGASAYPRLIDYERISAVAKDVSALFMVDMAHLTGLVAAGVIPSPVPHCDLVTLTCYKTMMGGRGGVILCKKEFADAVDQAVFPGCQGTSAVNLMAAKALIFKLAREEGFIRVQRMTLENAKALAKGFLAKGYELVTGGTDNHQVILDLRSEGIPGRKAEQCLESVGIVLNRNVVPADEAYPGRVSGIRMGSGGVSARGMGPEQMAVLVDLMDITLKNPGREEILQEVRAEVKALCGAFPVNGPMAPLTQKGE